MWWRESGENCARTKSRIHAQMRCFHGVKLLQPGVRLLRHAPGPSAEAVQLLQLAEELDRIVHAIDAELQLLNVVALTPTSGFSPVM